MSRAKIRLRPLRAKQELEVLRASPGLLPRLQKYRLSDEDATALASNICLVSAAMEKPLRSPLGVLEVFSLSQIADICEALERSSPCTEWEIRGGVLSDRERAAL